MGNHTIIPCNAPNPDRRHRRRSRSWKDQSKRAHQYRRTAIVFVLAYRPEFGLA